MNTSQAASGTELAMVDIMRQTESLIIAMADRCLALIAAGDECEGDQPASLDRVHLRWMCRKIMQEADSWPATKLHRWIGFVQGAMIANHLITLDGAKAMFDEAKNAHGAPDEDLVDHLDPDVYFQLDIGGEG